MYSVLLADHDLKTFETDTDFEKELEEEEYRKLEYSTVKELSISITNTGKKVMVRGWVSREEVSISLPNIFVGLKSLPLVITDTETFVIIDKPEYDLVLDNNWLIWMGKKIDKQDARY
ncbi:2823_t:CDS:2 [Funneliformis mosseae]|uniref:2823_t:CDS:1 n=1 Tax=Funneliformis mosseae TaxID=27381 RepID=A0A9N9GDB3_FUNMO|nr:2823_t:CDS:2 [Funneliformis mosseae]